VVGNEQDYHFKGVQNTADPEEAGEGHMGREEVLSLS
jgi:hypothetical protein